MYKCINGWTKQRMLDVIAARPSTKRSMRDFGKGYACAYLSEDGNKCAVGLFIPSGHVGERCTFSVLALLNSYPDLNDVLPLSPMGLQAMQFVHDDCPDNEDVKAKLILWVSDNVED